MTTVAETSMNMNNKFDQEFEEYRRACRERYQQHKPEEPTILEEEEEKVDSNDASEEVATVAPTSTPLPAIAPTTTQVAPSSPLPSHSRPHLSASTGVPSSSTRLNSSVEMVKKSGQRRNSFDKIASFFGKKEKQPDSPDIVREKEKLKAEKLKKEQDFRMAAFIAQLQMEGRSDEEIQMHLFHIRDVTQFRRPRSNSVGEFFRSMHQAFKDEFAARKDRNVVTISVSTDTPFYAAPPPNYNNDSGYTYEELVALENVPRGVTSLDHMKVVVYTGQELPATQTRCAICMGDFEHEEELRELVCSHHFHKECVDKWLSVGTTCPICKGDVRCENPAE